MAARIWIVNQHAYTYSESAGTRHLSLGRQLVKLGHEVSIVASSFYHKERRYIRDPARVTEEFISGVRFVWIPARPYESGLGTRMLNHIQFAGRLQRWAATQENVLPDVVLGSAPNHLSALGAARIARAIAVPFVYEVRDLWPETLIDYSRWGRLDPAASFFGAAERRLIGSASHVVSLLPNAADRIRRYADGPVPVTWLPNGVDFEFIAEQLQYSVDSERPLAQDAFQVLYAGSHSPSNGLDTIVRAAQHLQGWGCSARITMIGGGPDKPRLQATAARKNLNNIEFRDAVPKGDIYQEMRRADCLIVNIPDKSVYRYGISLNKIFEYMAMARPIVIGYSGSHNPVEVANCGISVPADAPLELAMAIRKIGKTPEAQRVALGKAGLTYAKHNHSYSALGLKLSELLSSVISSSLAGP